MMALPTGDAPQSRNGRVARGERTRQRLAEAVISLLEAGDPAPTARAVAAHAGVSLRLVFHHFKDMDAVYDEVVRLQIRRHWSLLRAPKPTLPLETRITQTVRARARLYEDTTPVRRAAFTMAVGSAQVAHHIAAANSFTRSLLATTFGPELTAAAEEGKHLLEAVDAAASWEAWDRLRTAQALGPTSSRRTMKRTLRALLEPFTP